MLTIIQMKSTTRKWIVAGLKLEKSKNEIVECPECGIGKLMVEDVTISGTNKIDRYLICDNCGKWDVIMMQLPDENHKPGD